MTGSELMTFSSRNVPLLPEAYKGKLKQGCGYTKSCPREWTQREIEWIINLKKQGYNLNEISKSVGRTEVSISIKLKRLGKRNNAYNERHRQAKYELNQRFLEVIKPDTVLDLYCGTSSWWSSKTFAVTNDSDKNIAATYNENAEKLIHRLYYEGKHFDVVDLDPFGSAYECFDLAIKMADKGVIITFGEMGHKRFKRLDYVSRYYGISSMEDFIIDNLISEVQKIGVRNKKHLTPLFVGNWDRISRVYFSVETFQITEQWKTNTSVGIAVTQ